MDKLRSVCIKKMNKKEMNESYSKRLDEELNLISSTGMADYFLFQYDIARYMKSKNIPFLFKNASSSFVLYLLGIHPIDPVEHHLLFQNYLGTNKTSIPIIDLDLSFRKSKALNNYFNLRYGKNKFFQLASIDRFSYLSYLKENKLFIKLDPYQRKTLIRSISQRGKLSIKDSFNITPEYHSIVQTKPEIKQWLNASMQLEGSLLGFNAHSSGWTFIPDGINKIASHSQTIDGEIIAHIPYEDIREIGIIKFDIHKDRYTSIIHDIMQRVKIRRIPPNNKNAFQLFQNGNTTGISHFESSGIRQILKAIKPYKLEDLALIIAMYRPGPLKSGLLEEYLQKETENHNNNDALLNLYAKESRGLLLYREQIIELIHFTANVAWGKAESICKAITDKNTSLILSFKDEFVERCEGNNINPKLARNLFGIIVDKGQFSFSKTAAITYAHNAYLLAYLKYHYPVHFYLSSLNYNFNSHLQINKIIMDIRFHYSTINTKILPIDINKSRVLFSKEHDNIRGGLAFVKHIGISTAKEIVNERNRHGQFKNLLDFMIRTKDHNLTIKSIDFLIKAGAFDHIEISRDLLLAVAQDIYHSLIKTNKEQSTTLFVIQEQLPDFEHYIKKHETSPTLHNNYYYETEATDLFLTHHPLDQHLDYLKQHQYDKIELMDNLEYGTFVIYLYQFRIIQTKNGHEMATGFASDRTGSADIIFYPFIYKKFSGILKNDHIYVVKGKIENNKINAEQVFLLSELSNSNSD